MAYYCKRCKKWHYRGRIARAHTVFSAKPKRPRSFKPVFAQKRQKIKKLLTPPKNLLTATKTPKRKKPDPKWAPFKKPKTGLQLVSKKRRGQLNMTTTDIYERGMITRIRKKTGMTHVQVMNLVNLAKKSDYIDVETEIGDISGLSREKPELYEFAKKNIMKKLKRHNNIMAESKYTDPSYYNSMWSDWQEEQKRKKARPRLI